MSIKLQVGNTVYNYPVQGEGNGHGEDATAWAEGVTAALGNFLGPNDLLITIANLANNTTTPQNIPGLVFNTGDVQHINVEYLIVRTFDNGSSVVSESGPIYGNFNGIDFNISIESTGDNSGIELDVTSGGQFTYTSSDLTDHVSSLIYFKASTIDS